MSVAAIVDATSNVERNIWCYAEGNVSQSFCAVGKISGLEDRAHMIQDSCGIVPSVVGLLWVENFNLPQFRNWELSLAPFVQFGCLILCKNAIFFPYEAGMVWPTQSRKTLER